MFFSVIHPSFSAHVNSKSQDKEDREEKPDAEDDPFADDVS